MWILIRVQQCNADYIAQLFPHTCQQRALLHEVLHVDGGIAQELVLAAVVLVVQVDLHNVAVHFFQRELVPGHHARLPQYSAQDVVISGSESR
jgi:hypothetical protein